MDLGAYLDTNCCSKRVCLVNSFIILIIIHYEKLWVYKLYVCERMYIHAYIYTYTRIHTYTHDFLKLGQPFSIIFASITNLRQAYSGRKKENNGKFKLQCDFFFSFATCLTSQ